MTVDSRREAQRQAGRSRTGRWGVGLGDRGAGPSDRRAGRVSPTASQRARCGQALHQAAAPRTERPRTVRRAFSPQPAPAIVRAEAVTRIANNFGWSGREQARVQGRVGARVLPPARSTVTIAATSNTGQTLETPDPHVHDPALALCRHQCDVSDHLGAFMFTPVPLRHISEQERVSIEAPRSRPQGRVDFGGQLAPSRSERSVGPSARARGVSRCCSRGSCAWRCGSSSGMSYRPSPSAVRTVGSAR
jgi:hypothetical protein